MTWYDPLCKGCRYSICDQLEDCRLTPTSADCRIQKGELIVVERNLACQVCPCAVGCNYSCASTECHQRILQYNREQKNLCDSCRNAIGLPRGCVKHGIGAIMCDDYQEQKNMSCDCGHCACEECDKPEHAMNKVSDNEAALLAGIRHIRLLETKLGELEEELNQTRKQVANILEECGVHVEL